MGISRVQAELIVREHKFRPLPKTVHLIGRQTVQLTYDEMTDMLDRHGIVPRSVRVEIDRTTSLAIALQRDFISDMTFFGLLGVEDIRAIDHSDFEGADIIIDLNRPLPADLAGTAEFVYGGSVLDNIFDPATYVKNIARLMGPNGRLIDQNLGSFHFHPYVITSPAWYFDYFVMNGFADCKIYFAHQGHASHFYGMTFNPSDQFVSDFGNAGMGLPFSVIVIAEKGEQSTWDRIPSQDQYRQNVEWVVFRDNLQRVQKSARSYEVFACPSPQDLAQVPLRWNKSFRYLGVMKAANDRGFDGTIPRPLGSGIKIIEASYGLNQIDPSLDRPGTVPLCKGNATEKLAELLNGQPEADLMVDGNVIGDPAPNLPKELIVQYVHLDDPAKTLREVHIAAEAHGKKLRIPPCPRTGIKIIQASYGVNQLGRPLERPGSLPLCGGNVTDRLGALVDGKPEVDWTVDTSHFGDPAPGLPKDLVVYYFHLEDPARTVRKVRVASEAQGRKLRISPLSQPSARGIKIVQASYGLNQIGRSLERPADVPLRIGNVTDRLAELVNGQTGAELVVDGDCLGDPAPGLPKELVVYYVHLDDPAGTVREVRVAGEAHGRMLRIPPLSGPLERGIRIVQASYGMNQFGRSLERTADIPLRAGNVTEKLSEMVDGKPEVEWAIDVNVLGDPAPDLPKELVVYYVHLDDPAGTVREVRVAGEAHGRMLRIPPLSGPLERGIKIVQASYGMNQFGRSLERTADIPLCAGNVTEKLSELVHGKPEVEWAIDVNVLGDPAPDLPKELVVYYVHSEDPAKEVCEVRVAGEAHGRTLRIPPHG